jgi:hypothetical protein
MKKDSKMTTPLDYLAPVNVRKTCRQCGELFDLPSYELAAQYVHSCVRCIDLEIQKTTLQAIERSKTERLARWSKICPLDFLATVPEALPQPEKLKEVLNWRYGPRGLLLHGSTGKGKSRCAWVLLNREFEAGRTVKHLGVTAGLTYSAQYADSATQVQRWIEKFTNTDLLLLDDVFKSKFTDSFELAIFMIVEERVKNQKPIILTSNDTGPSLIQRMSPDRGEPLVRRLREYCTPINFN